MIPEFIFKIQPSPFGKAIGETLEKSTQPVVAGGTQWAHDRLRAGWDTGGRNLYDYSGRLLADMLELMGKARSGR